MSVNFGMDLTYINTNVKTTCGKSFNDFSSISQLQGKVKSVEVCFTSSDSIIKNIINTFTPSFDTFTSDLTAELENWGGLSYEVFEHGYSNASEKHDTSYKKHISITVLKNPITKKPASSANRVVESPYSDTTFYFSPVKNGSDCIFFSYSSSDEGSIYSDSLYSTPHSLNGTFLLDNISDVEVIDISNNLTNCISDTDRVEVDGTQKTITLTADTGYYFNTIPTITINNVTNNFSLSQDKTTASYNFTPASGDVISVNASAIIQPKQAVVTTHLTNCVLSPDISVFVEHSQVTLTLTCSENYSFQDVPYINENITEGTIEKRQFTKINDREYSLTLPAGDFYSAGDVQIKYTIDIYATAIFDSKTVNKYGLVLLYKPNKDILKDLSLVRFVNVSTGVTEDLGQYITSLKRIYLDVESVGSANIICGKTDTDILCPMINDDDVIVDLGNVPINGLYQNGLDNKNLDIDLILPFIGVVKLNSAIMANKTINIKYKCNLITGICIAYIYLVENETLHLQETYSGNIGFDVPYILKTDSMQVYNSKVDSESIFNVSPQIKLYENAKASSNNSIYNTDLIIRIGDIPDGFFSVEKIINSNNNRIILNEELKEIENILKRGIEV